MIGIVIVTWNSADVIGSCLDACRNIPGSVILVVDNASEDTTVEEVRKRPGVQLIVNHKNRGFAGGVNDGIAALNADTILLLNPDAAPIAGIEALASAVTEAGTGAATGTLLGPDGDPQHGFNIRRFPTAATLAFEVLGLNRTLPSNPVNRRYRSPVSGDGVTEVDQPAAAFLMVNRCAWEAIGGFDESFHPVWFEDVDFCLRLRKAGFRILYCPEASARHIGGHSAASLDWGVRQLCWYESLLRYASKHFTTPGRRFVAVAVMLACVPRGLYAAVAKRGIEGVSVYSKVFWLAVRCWSNIAYSGRLAARSSTRKGDTGTAVVR